VASKSGSPKEKYIAGDVGFELARLLKEIDSATTLLILDPPATGLTREVRQAMLTHPPRTVIYVSCNPATLARDLVELQETYEVLSVTPFDMFPQTAEIEVVVQLRNHRAQKRQSTAGLQNVAAGPNPI
jgi:tRNA/tmRNA/rRNA uracil-C5-methylase (TrmA/RlmC/RlmD family)